MRFQTVGMVTIMGHILAFFAAKMEKAEQLLKSPCLVSFLVAGVDLNLRPPGRGSDFRFGSVTAQEKRTKGIMKLSEK